MKLSLTISDRHFKGLRFLKCLLFMCFFQHLAQAQHAESLLIPPDSSWSKEVFSFPLTFAPEIKYQGYEEAWFPKAWSKKDSESFWSYVFAWRIERKNPISLKDIKQDLKDYFNGLMHSQMGVSIRKFPSTIVSIDKNMRTKTANSFIGKVKIFDAFTLKTSLTLYVSIEQFFLKDGATLIVIFRFSPKKSGHIIWEQLNGITIN